MHKGSSASQKPEYRVLSLIACAVSLICLALFYFFPISGREASPIFEVLERNVALLAGIPFLISLASIGRLIYLRFRRGRVTPFTDGWLMHLVVLSPYVAVLIL